MSREPEVTIRPMTEDDAEAVAALCGELGYPRAPQDVRAWLGAAESSRQAAFVARLGADVVGWIEVSLERRLQSDPFVLIGGLVVSAAQRGHGIGRRLCDAAEVWAHARNAAKVRVTSRSTRPEAHRFYLARGFEKTKTSEVFEKSLSGQ